MKKQLLASLLSLIITAGLAPMAASMTTDNSTPSCSGSSNCAMDKSPSCPLKVLSKEECQRFCKAKAAAIAKNPSLAKPENNHKLCRAIVKADPSMKPICMKLRKNCCKMKKNCMNKSSCDQTSCKDSTSKSPQQNVSSSSQQSANPSNSSTSSMNDAVAAPQSANTNPASSAN